MFEAVKSFRYFLIVDINCFQLTLVFCKVLILFLIMSL